MSDYDVAVVGAGAAGIAAGLALQEAGRKFIVLEARDRVGGRAFTDRDSFGGLPFDQGAHWLHAAAHNPFTIIADRLGIRYRRDIDWSRRVLHLGGGRLAPRSLLTESGHRLMAVLDACVAAGEAGRDIAFSELMTPGDLWNDYIRMIVHQITSHEPEDCSTLDYARYVDDGGDYPVEDGYGTLVQRHAASLPVTLSTPVTSIDWSGKGVALDTARGQIQARAVVLAVPVNVLRSGAIRFTPALPARLAQALEDCPMGCSEKLAILLDRPIEGFDHMYGDVIEEEPQGGSPVNLHLNPFGRPLALSHLGGRPGRDLVAAGPKAAEDHARSLMVRAFGSDIARRIRKVVMTGWVADPWAMGGYSHARPGKAQSRLVFAEPVGDRIFLAGEHCSVDFFSTVHGAHLSGLAAARAAMGALAG